MNKKLIISAAVTFCLVTFTGCKSLKTDPYSDTPTTGRIRIGADETVRNIIDTQISVFQALYSYSEIKALYLPENQLYRELLADSVHLIIGSRYLSEEEMASFKKRSIFPRQTKVAVDGVALIVNPSVTVHPLSIVQLRKLFTGEINKWNQLYKDGKPDEVKIVFDNQASGIVRLAVDSICLGRELTKSAYALEFNQDVLKYVAKTPGALGLIGVSWISDRDDSLQLSFLNNIKVVPLSRDSVATEANSFEPYQAYLSLGNYPLTRDIIVINTDPRPGLASGFAAFVASDKGQRIILKTGILPAIAPSRLVKVRDQI
jgi:phosphate transport system substrate-binding protein